MTELNVGVRIDKKKKREKNKYSIYKYSIYYGICGVFQTICGTVMYILIRLVGNIVSNIILIEELRNNLVKVLKLLQLTLPLLCKI